MPASLLLPLGFPEVQSAVGLSLQFSQSVVADHYTTHTRSPLLLSNSLRRESFSITARPFVRHRACSFLRQSRLPFFSRSIFSKEELCDDAP